MNGKRRPVKRLTSLMMAVMMMGSLFSACSKIPRDTPYTFRVESDATGARQWAVMLSGSGGVSYSVQPAENGKTDVVFTGYKKGNVDATVYLVRPGERLQEADNAYVLTLRVDARKNVTQPQPYYGAYTVRLNGDVTGAEWHIEFSDERIVHCAKDREYPKKSAEEDGMQDFTQLYTFTGRRPGATHVRIYTSYPWAEGAVSTREDFWLLVDESFRVSELTPTDFVSFRVSEQGMRAQENVYEAARTADGVRLSHYYAASTWSDEANDYVEERMDETVIDGGESLYMYLAGLVHACGVSKWDGFNGSDPRVLDGTMFSFEAELSDGSKVRASGSNAFPKYYKTFWRSLSYAVTELDGNAE